MITLSSLDPEQLLNRVFGQSNVLPEWDVARDSQDALQRPLHYCPRIDYAIKPLNIDRNFDRNTAIINASYERYESLIEELRNNALENYFQTENKNPRCFLAIEYENRTSTKHRLGSLINAGSIGKLGIVVTLNDATFRSYDRILQYLDFVNSNKNIVLSQSDFEDVLRQYLAS
jgi:hypothetical protein